MGGAEINSFADDLMTHPLIQKTSSQTHEHILRIVHTETLNFEENRVIRLLDVGFGNGTLIAFLAENLPLLNPALTFEIYGFDVNDHGVQAQGYFDESVRFLSTRISATNWSERLALISSKEPWPYPDQHFDVILSNQVVEHIDDHHFFFSEIYRTLQDGGFSVHLFPLAIILLKVIYGFLLFIKLRISICYDPSLNGSADWDWGNILLSNATFR